ncbi:hypothetical protein NKH18_20465 [Streptomyces sp. M10(2022)]
MDRLELAHVLKAARTRIAPEEVGLMTGPGGGSPGCAARRWPSSPG